MQVISNIQKDNGFSLVELIVTILIIGILSTAVAPRFFGTKSFENRKAIDELLSALRYSQQVAMNRGGDIEFILNSNSFTVQQSGGGNLRSPDGVIPYIKIFPTTITAVAASIIRFNALGQPITAANIPLTSNTVLNIGSSTITLEANTGYAR